MEAQLHTLIPDAMHRQGLKDEHLGARLQEVDPTIMAKVRPYVDQVLAHPRHPSAGFGLIGKTGRGKSHCMAAVSMSWAYRSAKAQLQTNPALLTGWCPRWANWQRTLSHLKSLMREPHGALQDALQALWTAPVLVLDDLGAEQAPKNDPDTNWAITEVLFPIVDERNGVGRTTLWTSNLSEDELIDRYKVRIASRLFGMAPAVEMPAHLLDRRILGAQQ